MTLQPERFGHEDLPRLVRLGVCVFGVGLNSFLATVAAEPAASGGGTKLVAIDAATARLTNEELIDRLQEESQQGVGTHATAWASGFAPLDVPPKFGSGVLGSPAPARSLVMVELMRRGVKVIPDLLVHLSDPRPTKMKLGEGGFPFSAMWFADEYDFRFPDRERQSAKVNTIGFAADRTFFTSYTLKVGDLCYVALGEIVNRNLVAVRYQPSGCLVVNSPLEYPALARAARADWERVTETDHERSLVADLAPRPGFSRSFGAIPRLLFYYPATGRTQVGKLIERALYDRDAVYAFLFQDLQTSPPERRVERLGGFRRKFGPTYVRELQALLEEMAADEQPYREESRKLATELLEQFRGKWENSTSSSPEAVDYRSQNDLVTTLEVFAWPGLNEAVLALYRRVAAETPTTIGGRIARGDLALNCAKRLANRPEAREFASFFEQVIAQLKRDDEAEVENQKNLPPGNAGYHFALTQRIAMYDDFLRELAHK